MNRAYGLCIFIISILAPLALCVFHGLAHRGEGSGLIMFMGVIFGGAAMVPICIGGIVAEIVFRKHPRKAWIVAGTYLACSALASAIILLKLLD